MNIGNTSFISTVFFIITITSDRFCFPLHMLCSYYFSFFVLPKVSVVILNIYGLVSWHTAAGSLERSFGGLSCLITNYFPVCIGWCRARFRPCDEQRLGRRKSPVPTSSNFENISHAWLSSSSHHSHQRQATDRWMQNNIK